MNHHLYFYYHLVFINYYKSPTIIIIFSPYDYESLYKSPTVITMKMSKSPFLPLLLLLAVLHGEFLFIRGDGETSPRLPTLLLPGHQVLQHGVHVGVVPELVSLLPVAGEEDDVMACVVEADVVSFDLPVAGEVPVLLIF